MENELDRRLLLGAVGLAGVSALAAAGRAGPLTPPAGPVAASGRTTAEIEPRTPVGPDTTPGDAASLYIISQPGSYYLTGNLIGQTNKHGITITASGVSLDLMGFTIRSAASATGRVGVHLTSGAERDVVVANGSVTGWPSVGVDVNSFNAVVRGLCCSGNGTGIAIGAACSAIECACGFNVTGFTTNPGAVLTRCSATQNTGSGFTGPGSYTGCNAYFNGGSGFVVSGSVRSCSARLNNGAGISTIDSTLIVECEVSDNSSDGITATDGSMVKDCLSRGNGRHGIYAASGCMILSNLCRQNTQHGIATSGGHSRIEQNHCVANNRGIDMTTGTGSIAIHNTVGSNTTAGYVQGAGNLFGPNVFPANNQINVGTNPHTNYEA